MTYYCRAMAFCDLMNDLGLCRGEVETLQNHENVCDYPNVACRKKKDIICKGCQKILGSWDVYTELFKGPDVKILWEDANDQDESLGSVDDSCRKRSRSPHRKCRRQITKSPSRREAELAKRISTDTLLAELRSQIPRQMDGRPGHPHRKPGW
jgi:hypothetical protein